MSTKPPCEHCYHQTGSSHFVENDVLEERFICCWCGDQKVERRYVVTSGSYVQEKHGPFFQPKQV